MTRDTTGATGADGTGATAGWARRAAFAMSLAWRAGPVRLVVYACTALVAGVVPVGVTWLTKLVLDELLGARVSGATVLGLSLALAGLGVAVAALPQLSRFLQSELNRSITLSAQERLFLALERFAGLARFDDPVYFDRMRLAQQASATAPQQVLTSLLGGLQSAVALAGFLGALFVVSPVMAGVVLVSAVPAIVAELALSRRRGEVMWATTPNTRRQMFYAGLMADRAAAKETRLFGLGAFLRTRMLTELRHVNSEQRRLDRRVVGTQVLLSVLGAVVAGGGLVWSIARVQAGELTPGDVIVFIAAVSGVQGGLSALVSQLAAGHQGLVEFGHYVELLNAEPDLPEPDDPAPMRELRGAIELHDVWFRYDEDKPWVLRGVSLSVPRGGSLAIVGVNGAGKSTLVKLLCRLYDPTRGSITWDGVDIRAFPAAELRQRIGVVFQDHMNYDFTAADNIGIGDLDGREDRNRIEAAARTAEVHDTVEGLPKGYDTLLSRIFFSESDQAVSGVSLSGGQWQRVALARAMMRGARDLLILDEPSSGLDAQAEAAVHRRLAALRTGTTSVLISHRLNAVRSADRIAVLDGGRVSEAGDHRALMALDGTYAELFRTQSAGYEQVAAPQDAV